MTYAPELLAFILGFVATCILNAFLEHITWVAIAVD